MYSFDSFNEGAKHALTLAQEEAERSHHSYIGTGHLLVGLLRVDKGAAYRVVTSLGVNIQQVRKTIESVLGRNERIIVQGIIPTSRVKKVIEIAFEEARRMGHSEVDTGHMLMGLVIEGEGIAAHVLEDLGATYELVVAGVQRELGAPLTPRPRRPDQATAGATRWLVGAKIRTPVDNLSRLLADPAIAKALQARGLDTDALAKLLGEPPPKVVELRDTLRTTESALETTARAQQLEHAAKFRDQADRLLESLIKAEQEWLDTLA